MQSAKAKTFTASGTSGLQNLTGWYVTEIAGTPAAATVNIRAGGAAEAIIYAIEIEANGNDERSIDSPVDCVATSGDQTKNVWYVEIATGEARVTLEGR